MKSHHHHQREGGGRGVAMNPFEEWKLDLVYQCKASQNTFLVGGRRGRLRCRCLTFCLWLICVIPFFIFRYIVQCLHPTLPVQSNWGICQNHTVRVYEVLVGRMPTNQPNHPGAQTIIISSSIGHRWYICNIINIICFCCVCGVVAWTDVAWRCCWWTASWGPPLDDLTWSWTFRNSTAFAVIGWLLVQWNGNRVPSVCDCGIIKRSSRITINSFTRVAPLFKRKFHRWRPGPLMYKWLEFDT